MIFVRDLSGVFLFTGVQVDAGGTASRRNCEFTSVFTFMMNSLC